MEPKAKLESRTGFKFKLCKESKIQARPQGSKHYLKDVNISARVDEPPLRIQAPLQDLTTSLGELAFPQGIKRSLQHLSITSRD